MKIPSNTIYTVAFSGGLKCPRKIHFNTVPMSSGKGTNETFLLLSTEPFITLMLSGLGIEVLKAGMSRI